MTKDGDTIGNESFMDFMRDAMAMMRHHSGYCCNQTVPLEPSCSILAARPFDRHGEREFHHRRHVIFVHFLVHQLPLASMISIAHVIPTDLHTYAPNCIRL